MLSIKEVVSMYKVAPVSYVNMTKEELLELIDLLNAKINQELTINDLVVTLLRDERIADLTNAMIADVVRDLIPGSNTTAKSVSSIRSVANKKILADYTNTIDPNLSPRDRALAIATLEYDLTDNNILIKARG